MNGLFLPMQGHLQHGDRLLGAGGFLMPSLGERGMEPADNCPLFTRNTQFSQQTQDFLGRMAQIERIELTGDLSDVVKTLGITLGEFQRAITTSVSAFPVRENLEAEAKILVPLETPVRNLLPRTPGAGLASQWRQATSLGGGYGQTTTVTTGAASTTQTVGSTTGWTVGDWVYFPVNNVQKQIVTIPTSTTFTFSGSLTTTTGDPVVNLSVIPGTSGRHADGTFTTTNDTTTQLDIQSFFPETGAPEDRHTYYVNQTAAYKLLGAYGSVTGFAMAAGANFMNQLAVEKTHAIRNLMLNEENALLNGSSTAIYRPWGNGTTNYSFAGLVNLITTANGTPSSQVQTAVGPLTLSHIDNQIRRIWVQGGQQVYIIVNAQEILSLVHLAEASGSVIRVMASAQADSILGVAVTGYKHPITGEIIPIHASRYLAPGNMIFMSKFLPDGTPTADVNVLPQVQLPSLAPNESIQGYTAQELAPSLTAPQVYAFLISVYEVLRLKSALHAAISSGVTAV